MKVLEVVGSGGGEARASEGLLNTGRERGVEVELGVRVLRENGGSSSSTSPSTGRCGPACGGCSVRPSGRASPSTAWTRPSGRSRSSRTPRRLFATGASSARKEPRGEGALNWTRTRPSIRARAARAGGAGNDRYATVAAVEVVDERRSASAWQRRGAGFGASAERRLRGRGRGRRRRQRCGGPGELVNGHRHLRSLRERCHVPLPRSIASGCWKRSQLNSRFEEACGPWFSVGPRAGG